MKSLSVVLVVLALAIGACTAASDLTTSQAPAPASTTTSLVIPERVETTTTDDPGAADAATVERLSIAITGLMSEAELLRGLTFVEAPGVVVLEDSRARPQTEQARAEQRAIEGCEQGPKAR